MEEAAAKAKSAMERERQGQRKEKERQKLEKERQGKEKEKQRKIKEEQGKEREKQKLKREQIEQEIPHQNRKFLKGNNQLIPIKNEHEFAHLYLEESYSHLSSCNILEPGWQKLAGFRRAQNNPSELS